MEPELKWQHTDPKMENISRSNNFEVPQAKLNKRQAITAKQTRTVMVHV